MGNQNSSSGEGGGGSSTSNAARQMRGLMRHTGGLGLSKAELDERCRPSGLYPSCKWEDKAIRKLVGDGKVAPRLAGSEHRTSPTDRECPICFLQYRQVNILKCCSAHICTECYLQVRPQKAKSYPCPFCNHNKMTVTPAMAMNAESMLLREEAEQRVIEAKIRQRAALQNNDEAAAAMGASSSSSLSSADAVTAESRAAKENSAPSPTPSSGFGSSLQQHERIASFRARSSSLSEQEIAETISQSVLRDSFAMTPEERRLLEDEMRAQHCHPLSLQLEAEAEERRMLNEREYIRNNPSTRYHTLETRARRSSSRRNREGEHQPSRNWNQIVEAFERGGNGSVNSLDDLVVLEAAMILSMEEENRRRASGRGDDAHNIISNSDGGGGSSRNVASLHSGDTGNNNESNFDANQHANDGFPLVRSILSGRHPVTRRSDPNLEASRRRSRNSLLRTTAQQASEGNINAAAMDTAGLVMRGITEEDQIALAIAASLQDQQQQPQRQHDRGTSISAGNGVGVNSGSDGEHNNDSGATNTSVSNTNNDGIAEAESGAEEAECSEIPLASGVAPEEDASRVAELSETENNASIPVEIEASCPFVPSSPGAADIPEADQVCPPLGDDNSSTESN